LSRGIGAGGVAASPFGLLLESGLWSVTDPTWQIEPRALTHSPSFCRL
jgi:hypothetical protein